MPKYMGVRDVAERFGVSVRTVWAWLADPKIDLPRPIHIGRRCYFDRSMIADWEAKKVKEAAKAA